MALAVPLVALALGGIVVDTAAAETPALFSTSAATRLDGPQQSGGLAVAATIDGFAVFHVEHDDDAGTDSIVATSYDRDGAAGAERQRAGTQGTHWALVAPG